MITITSKALIEQSTDPCDYFYYGEPIEWWGYYKGTLEFGTVSYTWTLDLPCELDSTLEESLKRVELCEAFQEEVYGLHVPQEVINMGYSDLL